MMRGRVSRSHITHKHSDRRRDVVTLPSLEKRNVVIEVKRAKQCGGLPLNVPHKREINLVLEALPNLPEETSGFPSMATERAILNAIDNVPEVNVKRSYKVYTEQERRAGLIARVIDGKSAKYVLQKYGVSIRTQERDMSTIRELYRLNTKQFNAFRNDPTNHSVLREAIMDLKYALDITQENEGDMDAEGEGGGVNERGSVPSTTTGHCAVMSTAERIEAYMARREEERQAKARRMDDKKQHQVEEYHRHVEILHSLLVRVRDQRYDWRTASNDVLKAALTVLPKSTAAIDPELRVGTKAYLIAKLEGPMSDRLSELFGGVEREREEVDVSDTDREPIDAA